MNDDCYRVVYSSGGAFRTRATTAAEYILDPVFIQFIALSLFLYSALMFAFDLPVVAQLILLGAGLMTTFFWLGVNITLHLWACKFFNTKTIFTPVLLVPLQIMNTFFMIYVLQLFDPSYDENLAYVWQIILRTSIIILCLDIFHGKFVASRHSKYVPDQVANPVAQDPSYPDPDNMAGAFAKQGTGQNGNTHLAAPRRAGAAPAVHAHAVAEATEAKLPPTNASASETIKIGKNTFDLKTIRLIRSEDHYLLVQQEHQSSMVRGKLRDLPELIDVSWGLQINRSVWVAFSAIALVNDTPNEPLEIVLKDDTRLRVSESRRVFFSHSYAQFGSC